MTPTEPMLAGPAALDETAADTRFRLARILSDVLSPPVLAVPIMVIGASHADAPHAWRDLLLYASIAVLVPLADLLWRLRRGDIDDVHLPERSDRTRAFAVGISCTASALILLVTLDAAPLLVALATAALVQAMVLGVITIFWQVSVHSAMAASLTTVALFVIGSHALTVAPVVPLVGWARLHLDRHTPLQVVIGALVGAGTALTVLGLVL